MKKQYWCLGGTLAAFTLVVACSDGFGGSGDCKANRTCTAAGGDKTTEGGTHQGGADNAGGVSGDDGVLSGSGSATGALAGAAGATDGACHLDADCSNGDPKDGEEVCAQGACTAGNAPPTVVKVTPDDASAGVEPDASVVIEFSESVDPTTITSTTIRLLDGTSVIPGKLAYSNRTVTFTPSAPLTLLVNYVVSVSTGVTDEAGAALLSAYTSGFSIRDGAWKSVDAVKDKVTALSDALPISAAGNVLLAWSGSAGAYCPVFARWFLRGAAVTPTKAFTIAGQADCNGVSSGGNAAGVGAVNWEEPDSNNGTDIQQFRAGAWQVTPTRVSKNYFSFHNTLAVAPDGLVTFFEQSGGETRAWTTDASGKWPALGDLISSFSDQSRASSAFDAKGNGVAVWRAKDPAGTKLERIVASQMSPSGKWAAASDLPGSVTTATPASHDRGAPVVAFDSNGDALALWVSVAPGTSKLMASRFIQATGWEDPESISGALTVGPLQEAPGLAFDGTDFVAAWTAQDAGKRYTYTARYDLKTGWGTYEKQQPSADDGTSAARMPRLVSDGHGHLLLVFAKGTSPTFTLVYQRYADGAWSPINAIPSGDFTDQYFEGRDALPLSMSANGLAGLAWADYDASGYIATIRLGSFY